MWIIIKGACIIIVNSSLSLYLGTKAILTIVYVKNKSPSSAIQKEKITPKEAFLK